MGENQTVVTEFILLGFCLGPRIQMLLFGLFSLFYLKHLHHPGGDFLGMWLPPGPEILSVLKLVCADTWLNQVVIFVASVFVLVGPLCLVLVSYTCILFAILRIQSGEGRRKAFSTCSSHLCVVGLSFGSAIIRYMASKSSHPTEDPFPVLQFFQPMLNPLIYSLRNTEVKGALRRALFKESHFQLE
ncbi:hypothetical protein E2I00_007421 [Balaenoptera physalus]|uniref:G-protein coupled receptors family 1 profile domain-containing protein n=1 Tax=Balaenoptera physalus TaxID=9770 RepID=A0A6A1Q4U2_BALPH|nr:hypothetical protein E2I00_007421 [Balaenoptera physalus]